MKGGESVIFLTKPQELAKFRCTGTTDPCWSDCGIVCGPLTLTCIPKS